MKEVYFMSGLGADHRLFAKQISENIPLRILPWKVPFPGESIESYAERMAEDIPKDRPLIIGGVSFGGMMAIEVSKYVQAEKIILISSVKSWKEIPYRIKCWKYLPLYHLLSVGLLKRSGILMKFVFGKMQGADKDLFWDMLANTHPDFIKWAIPQIIHWKNEYKGTNLIHIHGISDLTFPIYRIRDIMYRIKKGTHIMVYSSWQEINEILRKELS